MQWAQNWWPQPAGHCSHFLCCNVSKQMGQLASSSSAPADCQRRTAVCMARAAKTSSRVPMILPLRSRCSRGALSKTLLKMPLFTRVEGLLRSSAVRMVVQAAAEGEEPAFVATATLRGCKTPMD